MNRLTVHHDMVDTCCYNCDWSNWIEWSWTEMEKQSYCEDWMRCAEGCSIAHQLTWLWRSDRSLEQQRQRCEGQPAARKPGGRTGGGIPERDQQRFAPARGKWPQTGKAIPSERCWLRSRTCIPTDLHTPLLTSDTTTGT